MLVTPFRPFGRFSIGDSSSRSTGVKAMAGSAARPNIKLSENASPNARLMLGIMLRKAGLSVKRVRSINRKTVITNRLLTKDRAGPLDVARKN